MIYLVKSAAKKYLRYKRTGLEWSIYARNLRKVSVNGLPSWITGIFVFFKSYSETSQRETNQFNCILRFWS